MKRRLNRWLVGLPVLAWFEAEGFQSFLGVPLLIEKTSVGVLGCLTRRRREWSRRELAFSEALALAAAAAIRNAQLYEEAQARSSSMREVAVLSTLVASSLDLQRVLDSVADSALALLKGDRATLWVVDEEADVIRRAAQKLRDDHAGQGEFPSELPRRHGLVGWVIEERRKYYCPNPYDVEDDVGVGLEARYAGVSPNILSGRRPLRAEPRP